jgi:hypothetical protein
LIPIIKLRKIKVARVGHNNFCCNRCHLSPDESGFCCDRCHFARVYWSFAATCAATVGRSGDGRIVALPPSVFGTFLAHHPHRTTDKLY